MAPEDSAPSERIERRLAAIMAADMVGFSAQMELDEAGTLDRLRACRRDIIHPTLAKHRGRMVKTTGDGALMEFASAVDAVACAVETQRLVAERNAQSDAPAMEFRIGVNIGDVMIEEGDIYGDGVNVAARLEPLAEPGGVLVSAAVRDQVQDRLDVSFEDAGERRLKNITRPVRVYKVATGVETKREAEVPAAAQDRPSIAVLPFENMSGNAEDDFFADGLTEDILTGLSRFKELFVISRTSAFAYKGRQVSLRDVAADLGVRFILEGSVRRAGSRVRVTAQLIDALGGDRHVWAERYDREIADIFALQDELTAAIVATLPGRIEAVDHERAARKTPENLAAYELVLTGKVLHHRASRDADRDANRRAAALLERATEIAPDYAHAWAWRACVHGQAYALGWLEGDGAEATLDPAIEYVARAQSLDDEDSDVHRLYSALGVASNDFEMARRHQAKALRLNPNDDLIVVQQGELLTWTGAAEEGIGWIHKAMALNPYHPERYWGHLGRAHFVARQYEEAATCFRKLSAPDAGAHAFIAAALAAGGDAAGAKRHVAEALRLDPGLTVAGHLAALHYVREEDREHHRRALLAAGLPEG